MEKGTFSTALMYMNMIMISAGEGYAFKGNWNNDFRCEEIDNAFKYIKENTNEAFWKNVFNLSVEEKINSWI